MKIFKYTENLSLFVEIARTGSFSAVANKSGSSPSSIMRKIDALEDVIGAKVFTRSARGVILTDIGETLYQRAMNILDELSDMHKEIISLNTSSQGTLRISCLPTFAKIYILSNLKNFKENYPEIDLVLDLTERLSNPSTERLDAALRIGQLKDSPLYATYIGVQKWIVCASPDYIKTYGKPESLHDLHGHHLIDKYQDPEAVCWRRILSHTDIDVNRIYLRCNDFEALRQAVISDLGIAFLPNWVVARDIIENKLVKLFDDPEQREDDIYFVRALSQLSPKLEIFINFLRENMRNLNI
ncbi:MAG: LysR family transcriptional regulator [Acinetobacter sp.]